MINYISSWAEQIIICVIVVTVLEMILPKGNSKKYIKTIMGIYILYVIISPAIKLITGKEIKIDYSKYEKYFNTQEVKTEAYVPKIEEAYKTEIEKQIKIDIEDMGYGVNKVNITFNIEEGNIENVMVFITKEKSDKNISINKVEIGKTPENNDLDIEECKKIKQKINENYGVDMSNITINSI